MVVSFPFDISSLENSLSSLETTSEGKISKTFPTYNISTIVNINHIQLIYNKGIQQY